MGSQDKYKYKYNGIEEEQDFGLNLNFATFRTLDPSIGRWMQVDPKAEAASSWSPYASMHANPIRYTDPDGDFIPAAILGAGIGLLTNGIGNLANGQGFFDGGLKAAGLGALGGAASFGIGELTSGLSGFTGAAANIGSHAGLGGLTSVAQGGSFGSGALSGAFGAGAGMAFGNNTLGVIGGGALSGGVGSAIAGGSFWQGAGIGLISAGLNHGAHSGALGEGFAASLQSGKLRHIFKPDAVSYGIDIDIFPVGGVAGNYERINMRVGPDKGKSFDAVSIGAGVGLDFSGAATRTNYYFTGKANQLRISSFTGPRVMLSGALTFGVDLGGSISAAPTRNGTIIGVAGSLGLGMPSPFPITGNLNVGYTFAGYNGKILFD